MKKIDYKDRYNPYQELLEDEELEKAWIGCRLWPIDPSGQLLQRELLKT
jgi:hypothetical protein